MAPSFLLAVLIGGAYGATFHIWQGKQIKEIFYYFFGGVIGFGLGQIVANFLGGDWFMIGPLHLIEASIGCWAILLLARWLKG